MTRYHTEPLIKVTFETADSEHRAYINSPTFTHGGKGSNHAEALVNAAMHWLAHVRMNTPATTRLPIDWRDPDWDKAVRVHDWRNHIADIVRAMWHSFTDEQKQALAISAERIADAEEWD